MKRNNRTIICKTCGDKWKPFTVTQTAFFEDHTKMHNLPVPQLTSDMTFDEWLKKRLEWKHIYFEDSYTDDMFFPKRKEIKK